MGTLRTDRKIRVLICNQYTLFREGLKALLRAEEPIEIVGEAETTRETLRLMARLRPDVVLLDAMTPDFSGSEATRKIKAADPNVNVLIVSLCDDEPLISNCIRAGAAGHISGDVPPMQLTNAIHTVCGDPRALTRLIPRRLGASIPA